MNIRANKDVDSFTFVLTDEEMKQSVLPRWDALMGTNVSNGFRFDQNSGEAGFEITFHGDNKELISNVMEGLDEQSALQLFLQFAKLVFVDNIETTYFAMYNAVFYDGGNFAFLISPVPTPQKKAGVLKGFIFGMSNSVPGFNPELKERLLHACDIAQSVADFEAVLNNEAPAAEQSKESASVKVCPKCAKEYPLTSNFCPSCGVQVVLKESSVAPTPAEAPVAVQQAPVAVAQAGTYVSAAIIAPVEEPPVEEATWKQFVLPGTAPAAPVAPAPVAPVVPAAPVAPAPVVPVAEPVAEVVAEPGKVCPSCGKDFPLTSNFCPACGVQLVAKEAPVAEAPAEEPVEEVPAAEVAAAPVKVCPTCGKEFPLTSNFCPACGVQLVVKETSVAEAPALDISAEEPVAEVPAEEAIAEQAPAVEVAAEPVKVCPICGKEFPLNSNFCPSCGVQLVVKEASVAEAPVEEVPAEEPVEEAPVEEVPAEEPVAEAPVEEVPAEEPVEEAPVEEVPAEEPVAEVPVEENPAEEPVAEAPIEEVPAEEPVEEAPIEEVPAEEPVAEAPAVEVPVEQPAPVAPETSAPASPVPEVPVSDAFEETTVLSSNMVVFDTPHLVRKATNEKVFITKRKFSVGKSRELADYAVPDNKAISRYHAEILIEGTEYFIIDQKSTNHTFVNGNLIPASTRVQIFDGDEIVLANDVFTFHLR